LKPEKSLERTCIVTRQPRAADELIRFVISPDGEVVPDLRRRLPGRGVHVTANAETVAAAARKHLFAKAFAAQVTVRPDLSEWVGALLADAATQAVSLARKAGTAVSGYGKVEQAITRGGVAALIDDPGAGDDGVKALAAACRKAGVNPPLVRALSSEQLDLAFGRTNVIHAALLAGPASEHALARIRDLVRYRGQEIVPSPGATENPTLDDLSDAPPGP
jgi:predicted RNA-binding protein YlxR (DUF448 family)